MTQLEFLNKYEFIFKQLGSGVLVEFKNDFNSIYSFKNNTDSLKESFNIKRNVQYITLENLELLINKGYPHLVAEIPTQSLVQRWLREMRNINISISFKPNIKKWDFFSSSMNWNGKEYVMKYNEYMKLHRERSYDSYEEALENGISEALLMIKS